MRTPDTFTDAQLAGLARGRAALDRTERVERGLPAEEPCACPEPPRRRRVVLANPTESERQLIATGPPPPPPGGATAPGHARRGRVTLEDAKRADPPWLRRVSRLVASGPYPTVERRPVWNGGATYHDAVVTGRRLP